MKLTIVLTKQDMSDNRWDIGQLLLRVGIEKDLFKFDAKERDDKLIEITLDGELSK